jgi:hypothetical protein
VKTRLAVLASGAVAALAAAPAASLAAQPAPPDMCFETVQFAFCTSETGPLVQRALADPAGTTVWIAGVAVRLVCESSPYVTCQIAS